LDREVHAAAHDMSVAPRAHPFPGVYVGGAVGPSGAGAAGAIGPDAGGAVALARTAPALPRRLCRAGTAPSLGACAPGANAGSFAAALALKLNS
jgi:hypothetical protein